MLKVCGPLTSCREMLDREGVAAPAEVSIIGDEGTLRSSIVRLRDVGVRDFNAAIIWCGAAAQAATLDLLQSELEPQSRR